ncbi:class I SAM-dependent rRNA methyltransferase [Desulfonauticus submarinus]
MKKVYLKKGRKKSVLLRHPWIFSGAIEKTDRSITAGEIVEIYDHRGNFLAKGYINPKSQITIRILSWNKEEDVTDIRFISERLKSAIDMRLNYFDQSVTNAFRLVNSEADFLPGLIIDKYNDTIVLQILTLGMEQFRDKITEFLLEYLSPKCIYERSDTIVRKKEGLSLKKGLIYGKLQKPVRIIENGLEFLVDVQDGQKTGFYLDQRDNRKELLLFCKDKKVLNCFSYTGAFSVYAIKGGAKLTVNIEFSRSAIELAKKNMEINHIKKETQEFIEGNAFELLRNMKKKGKKFDLIIMDPPKFAHTQGKLENALRGYKDINLQAMQLLNPGGILFTFSCSGAISLELFSKTITWAAMDANKNVQVIKRLAQPMDHPHLTSFLESEYLKGLICKIT